MVRSRTLAQIALLALSSTRVPLAAVFGPLTTLLLILLGPGAYSVDARLFGRRLLKLQ